MGSLYIYFAGSNYGELGGVFLGGSHKTTGGKLLCSDESVKLGLSGGKMLGTILGNIYGFTFDIDVGTDLLS